jgi:hypothetical protein
MMSEAEISAELADLAAVLATVPDAEPWSAAWMGRQSLLTRQNEILELAARSAEEYEVEVGLIGPVTVPNSVPASFMGRFLAELQLTTASVVQGIISAATDRGPFGRDVLGASALNVVGARPGSFILGLSGPAGRSVQLAMLDDDEDQPVPAFEEAFDRILNVFDIAENDVVAAELPEVMVSLGGHRSLVHLTNLAATLSSFDISARFVQHSTFLAKRRESGLTPAGAPRLDTLLSRTEQTTNHFAAVGTLTGVRWRSRKFDLEVPEGEHAGSYTGSVPDELRDRVRQLFDRPALVTIERTVTRTAIEGDESYAFKLVDLAPGP